MTDTTDRPTAENTVADIPDVAEVESRGDHLILTPSECSVGAAISLADEVEETLPDDAHVQTVYTDEVLVELSGDAGVEPDDRGDNPSEDAQTKGRGEAKTSDIAGPSIVTVSEILAEAVSIEELVEVVNDAFDNTGAPVYVACELVLLPKRGGGESGAVSSGTYAVDIPPRGDIITTKEGGPRIVGVGTRAVVETEVVGSIPSAAVVGFEIL